MNKFLGINRLTASRRRQRCDHSRLRLAVKLKDIRVGAYLTQLSKPAMLVFGQHTTRISDRHQPAHIPPRQTSDLVLDLL